VNIFKRKAARIALALAVAASLTLNVYQWRQYDDNRLLTSDDEKKISDIEAYINEISPGLVADVSQLAAQYQAPSWGCGPTSYALAKIINHKFFNDSITIGVAYENQPYEIDERFGFSKIPLAGKDTTGDHAWVEVYIKNKILFIDPTIAQYGKVTGIAMHTFDVGDPQFKSYLLNQYGVVDDRISRLVQKTISKIPADQPPYPSYIIDPAYLAYFQHVLTLRDQVNVNQEPQEWVTWVNFLVKKYG
jgi:hypothetical protein